MSMTPGPWHCTLPDETSAGGVYGSDGNCVCDIYSSESNIADDAAPLDVAKHAYPALLTHFIDGISDFYSIDRNNLHTYR